VQWANLSPDKRVVVVSTATSRRTRDGYRRTTDKDSEIERFGVYCGELDRCFLIPVAVAAGEFQLHLRLHPPRNGQRACITLAEDHTFDGAVAQLGERCHGMAEVRGSSPLSSTPSPEPVTIGVNAFRDGFGSCMDRIAAGEEVVPRRHPWIVIGPGRRDAPAAGRQDPAPGGCVGRDERLRINRRP
jgi:PD-(D/E)XK endonuclease